ncbi:hypothetical protein [Yersinia phage vB_Yru_GN1]|uniref:Uncharacterized protein n=1 Tax=Yersinia phage vB_Yru_GN1 TaxID=3074381 RepID=A0AA86M7Q1_9CAUD|nr:hypothetical protein [Yersinia phage vB_Yru_GN1]
MRLIKQVGSLKLIHVPIGESVQVDGTSKPSIIEVGKSNLMGMGCFRITEAGLYIITAQGSTGWRNDKLLHIQGSYSICINDDKHASNNESDCIALFDSIVNNKSINGIDISEKLAS